jgi:hypothetical protein
MKIKKQYELKDQVWIHLSSGKLTKGRVVDFFDLAHVGYPKETEFYTIEIQTSIDPILEIRTWEQISQDANGPIGCYRMLREEINIPTTRFLSKVGVVLPAGEPTTNMAANEDLHYADPLDPTPEEVNAAIERAEQANRDMYRGTVNSDKPKKRNFPPRGKNARKPRQPTL